MYLAVISFRGETDKSYLHNPKHVTHSGGEKLRQPLESLKTVERAQHIFGWRTGNCPHDGAKRSVKHYFIIGNFHIIIVP